MYVDVEPNTFHIYRLELKGEAFRWYIDGEEVASGPVEGPFPAHESDLIAFRAKSWYLKSTVWWTALRFGRIADAASGDLDSDADIDLRDYRYFRECHAISGPGVDSGPGCVWTDFDADGDTDLTDFGRVPNPLHRPTRLTAPDRVHCEAPPIAHAPTANASPPPAP